MQLSEDGIVKKMLNMVHTASEIHYYHTNLNGLTFHAV